MVQQVAVLPKAAQQRPVDSVPVAEAVRLRLFMDNAAFAVQIVDTVSGGADFVEADVGALNQVTVGGR
jgi:hypothetical protein